MSTSSNRVGYHDLREDISETSEWSLASVALGFAYENEDGVDTLYEYFRRLGEWWVEMRL